MKKEILTEDQKKVLLSLYPEYDSVNGPYGRKDGRYHVILRKLGTHTKSNRRTVSYPKVLMEIHLCRRLSEHETVDHRYGDIEDNSVENFDVLTRSENASKGAKRRLEEVCSCVWCGSEFIPTKDQIKGRNRGKAGPFCSRVCSGKYGKHVEVGGDKLPAMNLEVKYYSINNGGVVELV